MTRSVAIEIISVERNETGVASSHDILVIIKHKVKDVRGHRKRHEGHRQETNEGINTR